MSPAPDKNAPRRLVISPNWIGDAVMAQPLLQLLREQDPHGPIDVLAPAWVAPVWRAMQEVDEVIEAPFRHGSLQLKERWKFARDLKRRGYGAAYVLPNTLKFALIPWLAGIARRVGYKGESRYGLINVMHHDDRAAPRPMASFYAALAAAPSSESAQPSALPRPRLQVGAAETAKALADLGLDHGLERGKPFIAFAPGAEFGSAKRWPTTHFASLAHTVREEYPEVQIVLLGSAKDHDVCEEIAARAVFVKNLAGVTTLAQALALIAQADAMVSNDSGLLHIASALNRPVAALYGPTDPDHAPPFSDVAKSLSLRLSCSPCKQRECPLGHQHCMQHLEPDMVWQPLHQMLKKN
jgi:heptosyltransferase-2